LMHPEKLIMMTRMIIQMIGIRLAVIP
jgi:hypothetical protein